MWAMQAFVDELIKIATLKTPLKPHQSRVVEKIQKQKGLVVAHGLGSGKTLTSIAAQHALGLPADVVVPAALQANYLKERDKHIVGSSPEVVLSTLQMVSRRKSTGDNPMLIVDEAHRAREPGTSASQALRSSKADKRLLLTASPFYNRPSDIAGLVNIAAGETVLPNDQTEFARKYISEHKIKPGFMGRLRGVNEGVKYQLNPRQAAGLKKVLNQWVDHHANSTEGFPDVSRETVAVPMGLKQRKYYDSIMGQAPAWVQYKVKMGLPPSKQESKQLNAFASAVRQISNSTRAFAPGDPSPEETKIDAAFTRLQGELKSNPNAKAIVYSNYLESGIKPYQERLEAASIPHGLFTGEMKKNERDQLVRDFNTNKKKVILLSSAGGEGLDLKGTRLVQMLEPHWNNEKLRQVEGRAIRYKSHDHLPPEDRNVRVESYIATKPIKGTLEKMRISKPGGGIDEYLTSMSTDKDALIGQFQRLLHTEQ